MNSREGRVPEMDPPSLWNSYTAASLSLSHSYATQWHLWARPGSQRTCAWRLVTIIWQEQAKMPDVVMLAIGLGFFALAVGYAYACDRL